MKQKQWNGSEPTACEICATPLDKEFADAKTIWGPWAMICPECVKTKSVGFGQLYRLNDEGVWAKVKDLHGKKTQ